MVKGLCPRRRLGVVSAVIPLAAAASVVVAVAAAGAPAAGDGEEH